MESNEIQKKFVFLAIIFGMMFLILTPPFQSPDEGSHFKKSYVLAAGNVFPDVEDGKKGYYLPDDMVDYIDECHKSIGDLEYKVSYSDVITKEKTPGNYAEQSFVSFSTLSTNPFAHIIPAFGILMGKIVGKIAGMAPSYVFLLYFARMANLIAYVLLTAFAIRITPILKKTFCMLGLMPMALFLASAVSYDMLLVSAALLFAAMCFKLMQDEEQELMLRHQVMFGIIAFLFYVLKVVYLPIFALLFVILCRKYNKRQVIKTVAVILAVFLGILLVTSYIPAFFAEQISAGGGGSVKQQQVQYVISHPLEYLKIFFSTLKSARNFYVSSSIGMFGLVDTPIISAFTYLYVFVLAITGISEVSIQKVSVRWYERGVILLAAGASFFGIFLAMYLYWTPLIYGVGASVIEGVQGRYFLPLLPPCFLVFGNQWIANKKYSRIVAEGFVEYGMLASIVILLVSGLTILLRFWV